MLIEHYNTNSEAELKRPRTINLRVSYPFQLADKLDTAVRFVMKKIGFISLVEFEFFNGMSDIGFSDIHGNNLVIELDILNTSSNHENIIFHTDDCLRDYHKYIVSGVEFLSRPEYNAAGLQVKFLDDADNCYILLEERTYDES